MDITKDGKTENTTLAQLLKEKGVPDEVFSTNYGGNNYAPTVFLDKDKKTPLAFFYEEPGNNKVGYLYYFDDESTAVISYNNADGWPVPITTEDGAYFALHKDQLSQLPGNN